MLRDLGCGVAAAVVAGVASHPIDAIKVKQQVARGSGIRLQPGWWHRGLSASLMRQSAFVGTKFAAYAALKRRFPDAAATSRGRVTMSLGAGALGALIGTPTDLVLVRMQAEGLNHRRGYRSGPAALVQVARTEGFAALWRGCGPTVGRSMAITATQLAAYDELKRVLSAPRERRALSPPLQGAPLHVAASVGCSLLASAVSTPFDVVKSRTQDAVAGASGSSALACLRDTVRRDGVLALYRGVGPTAARQLVANAVRFAVFERLTSAGPRGAGGSGRPRPRPA